MAIEKVSIQKFAKGFVQPVEWVKAASTGIKVAFFLLLIVLVVFAAKNIWGFFFPDPAQNINQPSVVALPFSKIEEGAIDQRSTQILMEEKAWEASVGGGVGVWDNKAGMFFGGKASRKW